MTGKAKRVLIGASAVIAALIALRVFAALVWPTINDGRTDATPEYPDLKVQRFAKPMPEVLAAAMATANEMGLEVKSQTPQRIEAVATTRVFPFKDDFTIALHREGDMTVVNLRSHSRIGKGIFSSSVDEEFFNRIGHKRTFTSLRQ